MKLVTYQKGNEKRSGIYFKGEVYDIRESAEWLNLELPSSVLELLQGEEPIMNQTLKLYEAISEEKINTPLDKADYKLLAPLPNPISVRDGYAFRQHVETARRNRGVEMIPEFDQFPIFYFTNHNAIYGEGEIIVEEDHLKGLDFELECAIVIGKTGKNIKAENADEYIAGYMIMNDFSARTLQMEEMKLNLGPAKGKDFATCIGPYIVTPDELDDYKIFSESGLKFDLKMKAYHNGKQISEGNVKDMNWSFAEIIERASYGVELKPGEIIGSGTVGTGCYLELNGTWSLEAKQRNETYSPIWLKENDEIELEIEGLGKLKNTIILAQNSYSIMSKNKNAQL